MTHSSMDQSSTQGGSQVVPGVTIVIPLFNQVTYTKLCLESLGRTLPAGVRVIAIDNGSTDETLSYLRSCSGIEVIANTDNRGCSGAWNQGVDSSLSEWVVILNNDVITTPQWLFELVAFAQEGGWDLVSPAIREGDLNYQVESYARDFTLRMAGVVREGVVDGICFMVHRRVFDMIGGFDEKFRIGQFEDADFFRRAINGGFRLATTGRSFIHHFGSVTQKALGSGSKPKPYVAENREYFRKKWQLTWWRRLLERRVRKLQEFLWRTRERLLYGHTLKEKWLGGRLRYF